MTPAETKSNIPIICSFTFSFTVQITKECWIRYKCSYDMFITFMKNRKSFQDNVDKLNQCWLFSFLLNVKVNTKIQNVLSSLENIVCCAYPHFFLPLIGFFSWDFGYSHNSFLPSFLISISLAKCLFNRLISIHATTSFGTYHAKHSFFTIYMNKS
jgi:hypothetical protein